MARLAASAMCRSLIRADAGSLIFPRFSLKPVMDWTLRSSLLPRAGTVGSVVWSWHPSVPSARARHVARTWFRLMEGFSEEGLGCVLRMLERCCTC